MALQAGLVCPFAVTAFGAAAALAPGCSPAARRRLRRAKGRRQGDGRKARRQGDGRLASAGGERCEGEAGELSERDNEKTRKQ